MAGMVASNTATTITPVGGAAAIHAVLDSTSQIAFYYCPVTSATSTTITCSKVSFIATNNRYVTVISGTGAGQMARITSGTSTVLTVESMTTPLDLTSIIAVVVIPNGITFTNYGTFNDQLSALGSGLYARVNGTMTQGSPMRILVEGYIV